MKITSLDHLPDGNEVRLKVRREILRNSLLSEVAEDIARDTLGVLHVRNELEVIKH